jgi:hypothetical protein
MRGGRAVQKAVFIVAMFLASALSLHTPLPAAEEAEAAPNPIPVLSLSLLPSQLQAHITQAQLGTVTFGGNATVEKIRNIERVAVTLTAVVNTGWSVVISPSTIVFINPGTQPFSVTVIVPPSTSSLLTGNVLISGSAKAPGLAPIVSAASGVVTIGQFFDLSIEAEQPLRQVKPGELTYNLVNVYNEGNGQDTFELEIENNEDLVKRDFTVLLATTDITVLQDEYQPVRITIQTPQTWTLYKKEMVSLTVKVTSSEARAKNLLYAKTYPLFLYMKGYYIPGPDPFMAILALAFVVVVLKGRHDRRAGGLGRSLVKRY